MRIPGPLIAAVFAPVLASSGLAAQEMRVIAGSGVAAALDELIPDFERATGAKVTVDYTSGGSLRDRVLKGEAFDAGLVPTEALKPLADAGKLVMDTRLNFADARLAFAVKKGGKKVNATTLELFQAALTDARSIAWPDPKSGASVGLLFGKTVDMWAPSWGLSESLAEKTKLTPTVTAVAAALKSGEAELGVLLTTQIAADPDIELASLLPAELQLSNLYVAFVMAGSKQPDLAKKFIAHLSTPAAADVVRSKGFDPKR